MRALKFSLLAVAALFLLFTASPGSAQDWTAYTPQSFAAAQSEGKTLVVHVHAVWCPTCKAQMPTLDELKAESGLSKVVFMRVDFDKEKAFLKDHRVATQSTILVFQGQKETARSVAETDRARLRALVLGAVQS